MKQFLFVVLILFMSRCGKDSRDEFAECPTPFVLVLADQYKPQKAVGSVEAIDVVNDGNIEVHYGTKIQVVNKPFEYKFYVKSVTGTEFSYVSEARIEKDKTNGQSISFNYKVPAALGPGIYNAYFETICDGKTSAAAYVFTIKEKL